MGNRDKDGYGKVTIRRRSFRAHRVAYWLASDQPIHPDELIRHICDNPPCCRFGHLLKGSHIDNQRDMTRRGRGRVGDRNGRAVITATVVQQIRTLYPACSLAELSAAFNLSRAQIWRIATHKQWRHL